MADKELEEDGADCTLIPSVCYCPFCGCNSAECTMVPMEIPFFREIVAMNLSCKACGFHKAEVTFGGEIQEKGQRLILSVQAAKDLNRQVVKSDYASIQIPSLGFEIPAETQRGSISTLQGILFTATEKLQALQTERLRLGDIDNFHRCRTVIQSLRSYLGKQNDGGEGSEDDTTPATSIYPFQIIVDDPSGNSFVENPNAPALDPQLSEETYVRTPAQDLSLGFLRQSQPAENDRSSVDIPSSPSPNENGTSGAAGRHPIEDDPGAIGRQEVLKFETACPHCAQTSETSMCVIDIPHFKEVVLMSMLCDHCGYKSNEVKGGGAVPAFGTKILLNVTDTEDLKREVLKSDTAGLAIPDLDLVLDEGGMGSFYTTVEGLLNRLYARLSAANPFSSSTNSGEVDSEMNARYRTFLRKLKEMEDGGTLPFTLVVDDPLSNSFIGPIPQDAITLSTQAEKDGDNRCYEDFSDESMEITHYERTPAQNDHLGLNDIQTEDSQRSSDNQKLGTDGMEEFLDHQRRMLARGPDHPHRTSKAPVPGDDTVVGYSPLK